MSGVLYCLKCAQTVEADSFEQADALINHASGSKSCSGNTDYMRWNGEKLGAKQINVVPNPVKKSVTKKSK